MSLPRREIVSLLATAPALAMTSSHAADVTPAMPTVPWSRPAVVCQVDMRQSGADGAPKPVLAERRRREPRPPHASPEPLGHGHPPLAAGQCGGASPVLDGGAGRLFAFERRKDAHRVAVVVDVTAVEHEFRRGGAEHAMAPHARRIEAA